MCNRCAIVSGIDDLSEGEEENSDFEFEVKDKVDDMKVESKKEAENKIKEKPKLSIKDMPVKHRMTYILESLEGIG